MKRSLCAICFLGVVLSSVAAQNQSSDFDAFFAKFKQAVAAKDTATLSTMMTPSFNFLRAKSVPQAEVFKALDLNNGQQWTNLQQSVQGKPVAYHPKNSSAPTKVLPCTPNETIYNCLVVFQQDSHHQWRWKSMIMPEK